VAGGVGTACDNPNGVSDAGPPPLAIDAFPAQVAPNGEALLVVTLNTTCSSECTLCVGVPPVTGAGVVYIAGLGAAPASVVGVTSPPVGAPVHVTYRAPATAGDEIVSAYLFNGSVVCAPAGEAGASAMGGDLSGLLTSASVEITVANAATTAGDAGAGASSEAGAEASASVDSAGADGESGTSDASNGGG
jgi:hypothetical protein